MTLIEAEKNYIMQCPYIKDIFNLNVNYLSEETDSFSVEEIPAQRIIGEDILGNKICQSLFAVAGRLNYSENTKENIDNIGLFEKLQDWIEKQNEKGNFPELQNGLIPKKIEVISSGYIAETLVDMSNAIYQIELKLEYTKGV